MIRASIIAIIGIRLIFLPNEDEKNKDEAHYEEQEHMHSYQNSSHENICMVCPTIWL